MAVLTALRRDELDDVFAAYDLGALEAFSGVERGTVNTSIEARAGGERYFFRLYEEQDEKGALAEARLLSHFRAGGAKTPAPIARRDGALVTMLHGKAGALFPFVPGDMRCQASVAPADTCALGAELARLHAAAEGAEPRENRYGVSELTARLLRIEKEATPDLAAQAPILREKMMLHDSLRNKGDRRVVHGDVFRDNVLYDEQGVAAVLDFESAGLETRTYDLAVACLAFCFGASFDWTLARALVTGYESVRKLTHDERATLFEDACFGAIRFSITRITDCAMRGGKKDYRRFLARLAALESMGASKLAEALF